MTNQSIKRLCIIMLLIPIVTLVWAGGAREAAPDPENGKITLTMWGWDPGAIDNIREAAAERFPNITLDVVPVDSAGAFTQKIRTSAAAGIELPDLPWFERGQRGALYSLDLWENLSASPYNIDTGLLFDYTIPTVQNFKGEIVAIPWDVAVAGIAYKRDLARKYLGTDNPRELERMLSDWQSFIAAGKDIHRKSNGKVFMFAGGLDAYRIIDGQNPVPIVENGIADVSGVVAPSLDLILDMKNEGLIDNLNQWSPGWNAAISGAHHIFFPCPVWFPQWVIEPNNPDGKDNWGLIVPPGGGFNWGGTALGIASDSKNKAAAWDFLQWFLLSEEGAWVNREGIGFFTHYKAAYENPEYASFTSSMFGDQNIGQKWFNEIAPGTTIRPVSPYDSIITDITEAVFSIIGDSPGITLQEAVEVYKTELKQQAPELTIK